jgi:uncharacterized protein (DUF934 family)
MAGVIIITYFIGDVINQSTIDTMNLQHNTEISGINSRNENFTNYYLQGAVKMDSAREVREVANYFFDFALYWFNTALANQSSNLTILCIDNCTNAMEKYLTAHQNFGKSQPYFIDARNYTNNSRYLEVLGYYISFADAGQNITMLRYNASYYLRCAAENLSFGNMELVDLLMENFTMVEQAYQEAVQKYQDYRYQIDGYIFFSTIREIPDIQ